MTSRGAATRKTTPRRTSYGTLTGCPCKAARVSPSVYYLCLHAIYSISLYLYESIKSLYLPRGLPATEASPSGLGLGRCGWRPTPNASPLTPTPLPTPKPKPNSAPSLTPRPPSPSTARDLTLTLTLTLNLTLNPTLNPTLNRTLNRTLTQTLTLTRTRRTIACCS